MHINRIPRRAALGALTGALALGAFGVGDALASTGTGSAATPSRPVASASVAAAGGTSSDGTSKGGAGSAQASRAPGRHVHWRALLGKVLHGRIELGQVGAVGSSSVTVDTVRRGIETVQTTAATRYFAMLSKTSRSAVSPGDRVLVLLAAPASQSSSSAPRDAAAIVVVEPFTFGTVVSASPSRIVVRDAGGLQRDIAVTGSTAYSEAGTSIGSSAVKPGSTIFAYGAAGSNRTVLDASHVLVVGPRAAGIVSSVSGSSITIRSHRSSETVVTGSSTLFMKGRQASSISAVHKGDFLVAIGSPNGKTFAATAVRLSARPSGGLRGAGPRGLGGLLGAGPGGLGGLLGALLGK